MEVVFGLLAALCFGTADFCARFSVQRIGVYRTLFYLQCVGFFVLSLELIFAGGLSHLGSKMQWQPWAWGFLAGCLNTLSYVALYRAFARGKLSIVAPIASSYAAITVLLSLLSGEMLQGIQLAGIAVLLVGVVLTAINFASKDNEKEGGRGNISLKSFPPGIGWALMAALGLGITFWILGLKVTPVLGNMLPTWLFRLVGICLITPLALATQHSLRFPYGIALGLVVMVGLLDTAAFVASSLGFATGNVAIVSTLSSLYSAIAVLLAWVFLKERLQVHQWLGIVLLLGGIVLTHA